MIKAIFFGSIGVLAETSELQRQAYNEALAEHGVGWSWDKDTYQHLLTIVGGQKRLKLLSKATNCALDDLDVASIHARKTEIASRRIRNIGVSLRPGIMSITQFAISTSIRLGIVTSTNRENINAIISNNSDGFSQKDVDLIISREMVKNGKPNPEPYQLALSMLSITPEEAIAIEDTAASVNSAKRAGLRTIAMPGDFASGQDFYEADLVLPPISTNNSELPAQLLKFIGH